MFKTIRDRFACAVVVKSSPDPRFQRGNLTASTELGWAVNWAPVLEQRWQNLTKREEGRRSVWFYWTLWHISAGIPKSLLQHRKSPLLATPFALQHYSIAGPIKQIANKKVIQRVSFNKPKGNKYPLSRCHETELRPGKLPRYLKIMLSY